MARARADRAAEGAALLQSVGWFGTVPQDFRSAMLAEAIWHEASPGTTFIHSGDELGGMFGIARGSAEISYIAGHPDTQALHLVHRGFWAGYRPLLGYPRTLTLTARDSVLWVLVPQHALVRMLAANPAWWRHLLELSEENTTFTARGLADMTLQDSRLRAVAVLLRLAGCRAEESPAMGPVRLRISQGELAAMAVMSRNTLNRVVGELVAEGQLEVGYRALVLRSPAALRALL